MAALLSLGYVQEQGLQVRRQRDAGVWSPKRKIKLFDYCKWAGSHSSHIGVALLRKVAALTSWAEEQAGPGCTEEKGWFTGICCIVMLPVSEW